MDAPGDAPDLVDEPTQEGVDAMILLPARQVRWVRATAMVTGALVVLCAAALLYTVPRSMAYGRVLEENLELKERLDDIDTRMSEVDKLLLRLRLYDAQLRSLTPTGDHGPTALPDVVDASNEDADGEALPLGVDAGDGVESPGLRTASAWVDALEGRVEAAADRMERIEPNLTDLVVKLEDLRSLEAALPKRWPASGSLTSGYGWRRNPVGRRGYKFHSGLDVANKRGTPIMATADGVVTKAAWNSGYGRQIVIDHGYGITTSYSHCNRLYVREGDRVVGGQRIASIGSTGRSTGPHLHYEVHLDGNAVDPMDYVPRPRRRKR
jgi:murein DD-endopeptidase MepM/ murein hydrolase activator NlpD